MKLNGAILANTDTGTLINYLIRSLFSQVDVNLGGKIISSSASTYSYRAYLETLLNCNGETKETQLGMKLFHKDRACLLDDTDVPRKIKKMQV